MSLLDRLDVPRGEVAGLDQARRERPRVAASSAAAGADDAAADDEDVECGRRHGVERRLAGLRVRGRPIAWRLVSQAVARVAGQSTSTQSRVRSTAFFHCGVARPRAAPRVQVRLPALGLVPVGAQLVGVVPEADREPGGVGGAERGGLGDDGRLTGTPRMSAWNCMHSSLAVTPPSTLSTSSVDAGVLRPSPRRRRGSGSRSPRARPGPGGRRC